MKRFNPHFTEVGWLNDMVKYLTDNRLFRDKFNVISTLLKKHNYTRTFANINEVRGKIFTSKR